MRLRVALALIDQKEKEAVAVLVGLLPEMSREEVWRVEPVLFALAGAKAPAAEAGRSDEGRRQYAAAWAGWWKENGGGLDLAKIDTARRMLGLTLLVQLDQHRVVRKPGGIIYSGRVSEIGPDGKPRWQITDLNYPIDAQVVGPNRVLITEYRGRQVSERTFKGEIVWKKDFPGYPCGTRRLPNGHTLVNLRQQLIEVDRSGRQVSTCRCQVGWIVGFGKTRTGTTVLLDYVGNCTHFDGAGKQIKRFQVPGGTYASIGTHADVLPNGNLVIPQHTTNKVVEYDVNGRKVWEATVQRPTSVRRLRNGNTLVTSRYTATVLELDRKGKQVWKYNSATPASSSTPTAVEGKKPKNCGRVA